MPFLEIPEPYKVEKNLICNKTIQKLYSQFHYSYYPYSIINQGNCDGNQNNIDSSLFNYLKDYKFIIYHFTNIFQNFNQSADSNLFSSSISNDSIIDVVICFEGECLIIEQIYIKTINQIFFQLKELKIVLISANVDRCAV